MSEKKESSVGDMVMRAAVGALIFTTVTAIAGPIVGAAAASIAGDVSGGE